MDVLLIGSGGREHALAWKLAQSKKLGKLYGFGTAMVLLFFMLSAASIVNWLEHKEQSDRCSSTASLTLPSISS